MYELHITPKEDFKEIFIDIAQRYKLKLISHDNLDIYGNILYSETMIAEKCKDLHELNKKIELLYSVARQHNILRTKIESGISEDFKFKVPYKLGTNYYVFHIDILTDKITDDIQYICENFDLAISKNPEKETFMLTYRTDDLEKYKNKYFEIQYELDKYNIEVKRKIKEYCFCDDNIGVDNPWLERYNLI